MEWQTNKQLGIRVTLGIMAWLAVFDLLIMWIAAQLPVSPLTFVISLLVLGSLPVFALLTYWLVGLRGSGYMLDRNMLTIVWGPLEQVIPMEAIERAVPGREVAGRLGFRGAFWPGLWVGQGKAEGVGPTLFYAATARREDLVFVVTPGLAYAISPAEQAKFLEAFNQRKAMGPTQKVEQTSRRPAWFDWPLWSDRLAWSLVGLAAVALVLLAGVLAWRFQGLPEMIPLHYNLQGVPDRVEPRAEVFVLPLIGLLALLLNGSLGGVAYQRQERFVAYLLWAGALLVQALLWVACLQVVI